MRTRTLTCTILTSAGLLIWPPLPASAQDVRAGVEQLASQIAKTEGEGKQLRVAVADFPDLQGVTSDLGRFIASRLTTRLAQSPRFSVVERQRLGQVLAELKFSMSDLVDPAKAKQLGRMAGVEAIVVGTVADLGNQVDLDARVIDIETNRMLLGATTTISKDQVVKDMMERGQVVAAAAPRDSGSTANIEGKTPERGGRKPGAVEAEGFVFRPGVCRRVSGKLGCTVTFVNTGDERRLQINGSDYNPGSKLIDNIGNQYGTQIQIGPTVSYAVEEVFATQVPVNVQFLTGDVDARASHMTAVIGIYGFKKHPVVREIPIEK